MNLGEFEEWLTRIENIADPSKYLNFNTWAEKKGGPGVSRHEFAEYVCGLFETVDKAFDLRVEISQVEKEILITPDTPNSDFMSYLTLHAIAHPISLKNAKIKKLEMLDIKTDVNLVNVSIAYLAVVGWPSTTFNLNNCFIGDLILQGNCVRNFYVAGGAIFNIQCPPPRSENPFNGSVHFDKKVYLLRRSGRLLRGAQPYRNMRAHMAALENAPMVSRFHQLEQSVDRENLGGIDRFLSFGYKLLSNYGSSSGKPLVWILSLLLVTFFLALFDGGSVPGEITGWHGGDRHQAVVN
jgi:hypothetical protein